MPGNNFRVEVHSESKDHFVATVKMIFANSPSEKATHYISPIPERHCLACGGSGKKWLWKDKESSEYPCPTCNGSKRQLQRSGMVLLWLSDKIGGVDATPLPYPLLAESAIDFLWNYLQTAEYPHEPDHDGDNGRGFILTTGDGWGHVEGSHYAFLGLYPHWQMYGK